MYRCASRSTGGGNVAERSSVCRSVGHCLRIFSIAAGPIGARLFGQPPNFGEVISASDGVTYWASSTKASLKLGYTPRDLEAGLRDAFGAH